LIKYLSDLQVKTVLIEPNYFDRDYLAEFEAFYSQSARGYPNICKRFHFLKSRLTREQLEAAAAEYDPEYNQKKCEVQETLQRAYLGFLVVRPIARPLGRTVLIWYKDLKKKETPRVLVPIRPYHCHVAGVTLTVKGLAWQQQDTAVATCATVALWEMLHSAAFDEYHAITTTAAITMLAHKTISFGRRIFPSSGLPIYQIMEAIKEHNLAPVTLDGSVRNTNGDVVGFTAKRFASTFATLVRSKYAVLIIGELVGHGGHAIVGVGFRQSRTPIEENPTLQDSDFKYLYIHDDNLGPNVRFEIGTTKKPVDGNSRRKSEEVVVLRPSSPSDSTDTASSSDPLFNDYEFVPQHMVVAVHNELRARPDILHRIGIKATEIYDWAAKIIADRISAEVPNIVMGIKFQKVNEFAREELGRVCTGNILSSVRLELWEKIPPLSLFIGIIRIADGQTPLLDIIYDTTDSEMSQPVFANIAYNPVSDFIANKVLVPRGIKIGRAIRAY